MAIGMNAVDGLKDVIEQEKSRHGSKVFYALLDRAASLHSKKSHDYASNEAPFANYHFAGLLSNLFAHSSQDAGFVGRIGEKIYRLSNLEKVGKQPKNESVEDTELDILVITALWIADRQERREKDRIDILNTTEPCDEPFQERLHFDKEKGEPTKSIASPPKLDTTDGQIIHMLINRLPLQNLQELSMYLNAITR